MSNVKVQILKQNGHNFLWIDDYLWMWDIPVEAKIQEEIAGRAHGRVLVAGYGLGLIQRYLTENRDVKGILTIEKYPEVVEACKQEYGRIYGHVMFMDFFSYDPMSKFDCVIGDIWEDIVPKSLDAYKKFKNKAETLAHESGRILAWGSEYFEYLITKKSA